VRKASSLRNRASWKYQDGNQCNLNSLADPKLRIPQQNRRSIAHNRAKNVNDLTLRARKITIGRITQFIRAPQPEPTHAAAAIQLPPANTSTSSPPAVTPPIPTPQASALRCFTSKNTPTHSIQQLHNDVPQYLQSSKISTHRIRLPRFASSQNSIAP
jgi:hypothetical protein